MTITLNDIRTLVSREAQLTNELTRVRLELENAWAEIGKSSASPAPIQKATKEESGDGAKKETNYQKLTAWISKRDRFRWRDVPGSLLGCAGNQLSVYLQQALQAGLIRRVERGKYEVVRAKPSPVRK